MKKLAVIFSLSFLCLVVLSYAEDGISSEQNENLERRLQQNEGEKAHDLSTILVKFKEKISKEQKNDLSSLVVGKFKDRNEDGIDDRFERILGGRLAVLELQGEEGEDLASRALRALEHHPFVEYAEYNYLRHIDFTPVPDDERFDELWGLHNTGQTGGADDADINAPEAWEISTGSPEVIVGVIDTGIDYNHEDLADNIWINPGEIPDNGIDDDNNGYVDDIHGINSITGSGDPMDDHYHGTHCAGIIGAVGGNGKGVTGVNWTVKIIGIKFVSGGFGLDSDAVESINYAVALRNRGVNIRVLSNSWGGSGYSQSLLDAINQANSAGILFVAAAGNSSADNDSSPLYPASYDTPNVLAVASTDHNDNLSSFSNYGATSVDIAAPGSSILSTRPNNNYYSTSGTSMATPHVAGAAALLLSVNDQLTVEELKDYLMEYGDPLPGLIGKCASGSRLNVNNALNRVPPTEPTFRLSAEADDQSVVQGQTASYTIDIQSFLGYSDPVDLNASFNPEINGTITFNPNPGTPGSYSTMNIATTAATDPADYIITVTGVSGSISKTTTLTLEVIPENYTTVSYTINPAEAIPDALLAGIESNIDIPESLAVWKMECEVNITHTLIDDLIVKLISPAGTEVTLHNREGGSAHNIYTTYKPTEFKAEDTLGAWKLAVSDVIYWDWGTLDSWTLTIHGIPYGPVNQAPTVSARSPSDNATDVAVDSAITATFSEAMDAATINTNTFVVDNGVTGTVSYDVNSTTATFTPTMNLDYNTTYTATITTGARDLSGNALQADHTWLFTTCIAYIYYRDADEDGYGDPNKSTQACSQTSGYVADSTDCDDTDPSIHPGAFEVCNGKDDNCDGTIDEGVKNTYYRDADRDGYGDPSSSTQACTQPSGYVTDNTDCDDTDPNEHPGQTWYKDADSDGYSDGSTNTSSCIRPTGYKVTSELTATSGDCDDNDQNQNPGAPEVCNGEDDDCDGETDEGCVFNNPPEADAGSNQTVVEGDTFTLDGSNSSDPDGDTISYHWTQIGGIPATLSDRMAAKPTFVTPIVSPGGIILTFELVVKDDEDLQDSAQVTITVNDNGIDDFPDDVLTMTCSTGKHIGVKVESGGAYVSITAIAPVTIPDSSDKPENLPYGLFDLLIKADAVGGNAKVTFYLESQAGNDDKWFKYKTSTGVWEDCSAYAVFNAARDQVTITLVDGGEGDDGPADGWIVDPSGLSSSASTSTSSDGGGGGGGGCFIATAADG